MTDVKKYEVKHVQNMAYVNQAGRVINGFALLLYLPEFDEETTINVPNSNPATVKAAAEKYYNNRKKFAELG